MASKYTDYCSFCGRGKSEVDVLIAGEIASICKVASEAQIEEEISEELAEASKEFNKIDGISDVVSDYDVDENDEDLENNDNE